MSNKRSLYCCQNAHCFHFDGMEDRVRCIKGHPLSDRDDGMRDYKAVARGAPLELDACRMCEDYDHMGDPIGKSGRGWL